MSFPKLHVRNIFELFIPVSGFAQINVALSTTPSFGVTITQPNIPNFNYHYQILLYDRENEHEDFNLVASDHEVFAWGKRSPYTIKRNTLNNELEGILLKIKVNHGVFKFRKIKKRPVRFQVNCFNAAQFIQRGVSQICEINPKKRGAEDGDGEDDGVSIPIMWLSNDSLHSSPSVYDSPSYHSSDPNFQSSPDQDSPYEESYDNDPNTNIHALSSSDMDTSVDDSTFGTSQPIVPIPYREGGEYVQQIAPTQQEQYMVLFNGNAEVIGNFRALNFYKASDINLKEDIRLLQEDYDCRDALLKIDGVEYKFKDHVNHARNKRFVGYIAQQIGSVIPNAVQLIDGILHVDYESLIPYLSEAMKQNFQDIKNVKSETERITKIMDVMYAEFSQKEQRRKEKQKNRETSTGSAEKTTAKPEARVQFDFELDEKKSGRGTSVRKKWWIYLIVAAALVLTAGVTLIAVKVARQPGVDVVPPGDDPLIREVLQEFYRSTKGGGWKYSQGWLQSGLPYCSWKDITCNERSEIVEISLVSNNLKGVIPQSIQTIKTLQVLMLSGNSIAGKVPTSISTLKNLTKLDLSNNEFEPWSLPEEFAKLTKLQLLSLDNTKLIGSVPVWLRTLKKLTSLNLANNRLHGTITELQNSLREVDLTNNQLSGRVPKFAGNTTQLNSLKLGSNFFTGDLTPLKSVAWVDIIDISNNRLDGDAGTAGNGVLDSLTALIVQNNQFELFNYQAGSVPRKLTYCQASNNPFKCPIPGWLKNNCGASCK